MRKVKVGDVVVRAWDVPGPPVLMLPPLGRTGADLVPLAERLATRGLAPLVADPPDPIPAPYDLGAAAAGALVVLDGLAGPAPVRVLGATFGGRVARRLAADRPDRVDRLVVLGPGGIVPPSPKDTAAARRFMAALAVGGPDAAAIVDGAVYLGAGRVPSAEPWRGLLTNGWRLDALRAQREAARVSAEDEGWVGGGGRPMLAVQGLDDRIAPPGNLDGLTVLAGADVRPVRLAGVGHWMAQEDPDRVAAAVLPFLLADKV